MECQWAHIGPCADLAFRLSPSMDTRRGPFALSANPFPLKMAAKRGTVTLRAQLLKFAVVTNGRTTAFLASRFLPSLLALRGNLALAQVEK